MNKNIPLYISSVFFLVVGAIHVLRYFYHFRLMVGRFTPPVEASLFAGLALLVLALWCALAAKKK